MNTLRTIEVEIKIGKVKQKHQAGVIPESYPIGCILGSDFLTSAKASLDYGARTARLFGEKIPMEKSFNKTIAALYPLEDLTDKKVQNKIEEKVKKAKIPEPAKAELDGLLRRNASIFKMQLRNCGEAKVPPHYLELNSLIPISQRAYKVFPA